MYAEQFDRNGYNLHLSFFIIRLNDQGLNVTHIVKILVQARQIEDLFPFKSLHFEALHGNKEGRFSVKANDQYRVEFTVEETKEQPIVTICNIMELSNHYK